MGTPPSFPYLMMNYLNMHVTREKIPLVASKWVKDFLLIMWEGPGTYPPRHNCQPPSQTLYPWPIIPCTPPYTPRGGSRIWGSFHCYNYSILTTPISPTIINPLLRMRREGYSSPLLLIGTLSTQRWLIPRPCNTTRWGMKCFKCFSFFFLTVC